MATLIAFVFITVVFWAPIQDYCIKFMGSGRDKFIDEYIFSESLFGKVLLAYPDLRKDNLKLVENSLRQYFRICRKAKRQMVVMPSQIVDVAWHAFILHSKEFHDFCKAAFGYQLHHRPFSKTDTPDELTDAIKLTWRHCCELDGIDPKKPAYTPMLFFIDFNLNIPDGNKFSFEVSRYIETNQYDNVIENLISIRDLLENSGGGCGGDGCGGCVQKVY